MHELTKVLRAFAQAMSSAWPAVTEVAGTFDDVSRADFVADWQQSMWEMLVEAYVSRAEPVYLEVYGDGADCSGPSSRVFMPDAVPTHAVRCVASGDPPVIDALTGKVVHVPSDGVLFDRLVTLDRSGWYDEAPPFDHVLMQVEGLDVAVPLERIEAVLASIAK